jgi:hypothetical protein
MSRFICGDNDFITEEMGQEPPYAEKVFIVVSEWEDEMNLLFYEDSQFIRSTIRGSFFKTHKFDDPGSYPFFHTLPFSELVEQFTIPELLSVFPIKQNNVVKL